jgi:hypothetical protein
VLAFSAGLRCWPACALLACLRIKPASAIRNLQFQFSCSAVLLLALVLVAVRLPLLCHLSNAPFPTQPCSPLPLQVVPASAAAMGGSLGAALEVEPVPAFEQAPLGTRRVCFLSGMYAAEVMETISAYREIGEGAC